MEVNPESRHCLSNYFLQIYCLRDQWNEIDFYSHEGRYETYPLLTASWLTTEIAKSYEGGIIGAAVKILRSGSYIEAFLDEYYIRAKSAYARTHFPHHNLIYGFSLDKKIFFCQGFINNGSFAQFQITFEEFEHGLRDDLGLYVYNSLPAHDVAGKLIFSPTHAANYLTDFIESKNSFANFQHSNGIFGAAAYSVAVEQVESNAIDIRSWQIFYEHKLKLVALCRYLKSEYALIVEPISDMQQLADDFLEIRNYIIQTMVQGGCINTKSLARNISIITNNENRLIATIISKLQLIC
jgi:hypothetical protein